MVSNTVWGAEARTINGTASEIRNQTSLLNFRNFMSDGNIRPLLGTNTFLSDNKILRSWQYMFFMLSYCVICSLIGILSVTFLPDPATQEIIRGGGDEVDDETMEAAAHNMQGAYETYGDSSYQYVANELASQHFDEYGEQTNNYASPDNAHTSRYSRSMTGNQNTGYKRSIRHQNGSYPRLMEQQNGYNRRSMGQQNNDYESPMAQQSSSYSSLSARENDGYYRPMNNQNRVTPPLSTETQNDSYTASDPAMQNGDDGTMPTENPINDYSASSEASNSTSNGTTIAPGSDNKKKEHEDLIPNYGFLENSLYARYLEFYNKHKKLLEEHFGYSKKGGEEEEEEEEIEEETEEPPEGSYTELPMDQEPPEDSYEARPMDQETPKEGHSRLPTYPRPTHWVLVPQQYRPPYQNNRLQSQQYRPQPAQQEAQSLQYRPQHEQQELQSQLSRPQPEQQESSHRYRPYPEHQELQSHRYRPQPKQQELQSQQYTESKPQQQYQSSGSENKNETPPSNGNPLVSSYFQKVYLASEESSNGERDLSAGVAYSGQYSTVNGDGDRPNGNPSPKFGKLDFKNPPQTRGEAQVHFESTESSYLSYKPHSEK